LGNDSTAEPIIDITNPNQDTDYDRQHYRASESPLSKREEFASASIGNSFDRVSERQKAKMREIGEECESNDGVERPADVPVVIIEKFKGRVERTRKLVSDSRVCEIGGDRSS